MTIMAQVDIVALGEPLIEMVRLPETQEGKVVYQRGVGGDALNAMVAVARQGGSAGLISAIGRDPFGQEILRFCAQEGVDTSGVVARPQDPTGVCFIEPHPKGRSFSYARKGSAASLFCPAEIPVSLIAKAKILHVTAISQAISTTMRAAVERAARIARKHGTLVSYDLNLRLNLWTLEEARACIRGFLPLSDIVLPSDDESELIFGTGTPNETISHLLKQKAGLVALKRGAKGAILASPEGATEIPAPDVDAIDSAGAGDSFAGAFLCHYVETGDAALAARRAVDVAAQTVTGFGATESIPRRSADNS